MNYVVSLGPKGLGNLAQVCVGFEGGLGPKGLGDLAQALAWVGVVFTR
jgi:hypothetical protein